MSSLRSDARFAFRMMARHPGSTAVSVLTLALAIGANTAIFSVVNGALLRPLPLPDAGRLYQVMRIFGTAPPDDAQSVPKFVMFRDQAESFERMAAYDNLGSGFNLTGGSPVRVIGSRVTADFFAVLGVPPALGRTFRPEEDRPGGPRVVMLSDGLWKRRFGANRTVLGQDVALNGEIHTIVGVMPEAFGFPAAVELWIPLQADESEHAVSNFLEVIGRLRSGVTVAEANAGMAVLADRYRDAYPDEVRESERFGVYPVQEVLYGSLRPALLVLGGAVGFVLLIACVNLANLQLARAAARRREVALRAILGARPSEIARQLLTESLLVGLLGGAVGLMLARGAIPPLLALGPDTIRALPVPVDGTVLVFTLVLSLGTGLLFGLVPAAQAMRVDLRDAVSDGSARATPGASSVLARRLLVVSEVALAIVLLVGASLLVRSFVGLRDVDPGFRSDHVLTMKLSMPEATYGEMPALERFAARVTERVRALPGVEHVALAASLPTQGGPDMPFTIEGRYVPGGDGEGAGGAYYRPVTPEFFAALDIPVLRGRAFTAADAAVAPLVAIINESTASRFWPDQDPIGQRIWVGQPLVPDLADPTPREIVGVVRDVRENGLDQAPPGIVYVPLGQMAPSLGRLLVRLLPQTVVVRTAVPPASVATAVQRAIWAEDPDQPITNVLAMDEILARSLGSQQFNMLLVGAMAAVALLLAAVGVYGVLSHLVEQRTREIGVRLALGASAGRVQGLVLRQGMTAVALGIALGLAGALALTRLLQSLIHGISVRDPLAFAAAPGVLLLVALVSIWLPARRAARVDPMIALRAE